MVQDFFEYKHDLRKGRIAAIVLDHMRDYWAIYLNKNTEWSITEKLLKEEIYSICSEVALIRDVCNATKHGILRESKSDTNIPKSIHSTEQIKAEQNEGLFVDGFDGMFTESNFVFIQFEQEIEINGEYVGCRFLHEAISEVMRFWEEELDCKSRVCTFSDQK